MKINRQKVFEKYNGLCAYSGTPLESDWQVDHLEAVVRDPFSGKMERAENDNFQNMMPSQRLINLYKHSYTLEDLKGYSLLGGLHLRLKKLPKNPITEKSKKRKARILKLAEYFGITETSPFNGKFYFETIKDSVL